MGGVMAQHRLYSITAIARPLDPRYKINRIESQSRGFG